MSRFIKNTNHTTVQKFGVSFGILYLRKNSQHDNQKGK